MRLGTWRRRTRRLWAWLRRRTHRWRLGTWRLAHVALATGVVRRRRADGRRLLEWIRAWVRICEERDHVVAYGRLGLLGINDGIGRNNNNWLGILALLGFLFALGFFIFAALGILLFAALLGILFAALLGILFAALGRRRRRWRRRRHDIDLYHEAAGLAAELAAELDSVEGPGDENLVLLVHHLVEDELATLCIHNTVAYIQA